MFLAVSMTCPFVSHVTHTDNIKKALRFINTGYRDMDMQNTALHPWGVFAFVCGFERAENPQQGVLNHSLHRPGTVLQLVCLHSWMLISATVL